jgi:hypothetical protein
MVSCHRIFFTFNTKKIFHLSATFLLLLPLLSCGFKKPTIANAEFSIGKIKSSSFGPIINADEILSALTLINISTPKGFYPVKAALIIKRPSHLRLEILPVIGVPDFFLTVPAEKMKIFIPSQGELYSGRPTVSNLQKFLPWPIEIEDMIMIFTGTYPLFKENNITYQADQEDDLLRVEMNAPSGSSQIIWLGKNNKLLKLVRKDETGEELYNVKYTYDDDHNDFPEKIIINMADETTSLSVKYLDVKIEKTTDLSIFDLAIPENAKEIILE